MSTLCCVDAVVPTSVFDGLSKVKEPALQLTTQLSDLSYTILTLQRQANSSKAQVNSFFAHYVSKLKHNLEQQSKSMSLGLRRQCIKFPQFNAT